MTQEQKDQLNSNVAENRFDRPINQQESKICPHLNCLVYHPDGVCRCDMKRHCNECKGIKTTPSETGNASDWEKDFERDLMIPMKCRNSSDDIPNTPCVSWDVIESDIKSFVKSLLSSKREAIEKEMDDNGIAGVLVRSIIKKYLS